jgi:Fe-S-cluster-containing dehydrogenase component/formate-dependent nitrite reductase membrane component NrfD
VRYGFVIDQRKCIGCHACTVACKSEHEVPVGVFRTWVKYVESGEFPQVRRHFSVLRCNHCEAAPCVTACPTKALFKRPDGIVDFDNRRCIGCKACMQACPYDALYIDPVSHTAAKCNYCAHRVDQGLLPACVVVCPEKAIIAGDIDDPSSEIHELLGREPISVRKPEQGTKPKVFYIGAEDAALTPEALARGQSYMWAELRGGEVEYVNGIDAHTLSGVPVVPFATDDAGAPSSARAAADPALAKPGAPRVAYDVAHTRPWGWKVAAYLWTKSIGAGALGVAAALLLAGWGADDDLLRLAAPLLGLLGITLTAVLLVADLKRPERFWFLLTKPNFSSWLVWGGYALSAFGALASLWLLAGVIDVGSGWRAFGVVGLPLAALAAGYTAFLFGQAEGRDFWQSPLLLPHLLVQATIAGTSALALTASAIGVSVALPDVLAWLLLGALAANALLLYAELGSRHPTIHVARAAATLIHGRGQNARVFWVGAVALGLLVPLALTIIFLAGGPLSALGVAAALALLGLLAWEYGWVRAGQAVPLS